MINADNHKQDQTGTPEELGVEKKANYEFPSDDELDSIMEE